jgi:hypothetical protein
MQDADQIVAECRDLIVRHTIDAETARNVVVKAMLLRPAPSLKGDPVEFKQTAGRSGATVIV